MQFTKGSYPKVHTSTHNILSLPMYPNVLICTYRFAPVPVHSGHQHKNNENKNTRDHYEQDVQGIHCT